MKTSNLEQLLDFLRLHIGDTGIATYSDETLHNALRYAVSSLMPRWSNKYYLDVDGVVHRSPDGSLFYFSSPPVVQSSDVRPIVLMASIIMKGGKKFSGVDNAVSWRDDEVSFSNLESSRQMTSTLNDDINELNRVLPTKLARPLHGTLYGFRRDWDI